MGCVVSQSTVATVTATPNKATLLTNKKWPDNSSSVLQCAAGLVSYSISLEFANLLQNMTYFTAGCYHYCLVVQHSMQASRRLDNRHVMRYELAVLKLQTLRSCYWLGGHVTSGRK